MNDDVKTIAFVLYPGLTPLDLIGPLQVMSDWRHVDRDSFGPRVEGLAHQRWTTTPICLPGSSGQNRKVEVAKWRSSSLAWVGTRTERPEPTVTFFRDLLGLRLALQLEDFWVLKLPDGSKVEVFGPDSPVNRHFTTGPVAGFLVDDVFDATEELRSAGVEILLEPELDDSGNAWVHFRAPDGNIYEFTQDSGVTRPG